MNKKDLMNLLTGIKKGSVKLEDAIAKAETSRGTLPWEAVELNGGKIAPQSGFLYKATESGVIRLKYNIPGKRLSIALPNEKAAVAKNA